MSAYLLFGLLASFFLTINIIPNLIALAQDKKLFDTPNDRKVHQTPIPTLGGIAFFITFWLVSISLSDWMHLLELRFILIGTFLLFIISLNDDLIGMSAKKRLLMQFSVGLLCFFSGFQLNGFYGLFGLTDLPNWINLPVTLLAVALIINAYNLIDGINGLAGSLGLTAILIFAALFWQAGLMNWCLTSLIVAGTIAGFLKFNFGKATIFMGDNGSTFIGFLIAVFFIKFLNFDYYQSENSSALLTAISIVFIPVFDLIRVFLMRIINKKGPMSPDKTHLHHHLLNMGKSHVWVCCFILIMHFLAFAIGHYFLQRFSLTLSLLLTVLIEVVIVVLILCSLELTSIKKMESTRHTIGLWE